MQQPYITCYSFAFTASSIGSCAFNIWFIFTVLFVWPRIYSKGGVHNSEVQNGRGYSTVATCTSYCDSDIMHCHITCCSFPFPACIGSCAFNMWFFFAVLFVWPRIYSKGGVHNSEVQNGRGYSTVATCTSYCDSDTIHCLSTCYSFSASSIVLFV